MAERYLKEYSKTHKNDRRLKTLLKDGSFASIIFNENEK